MLKYLLLIYSKFNNLIVNTVLKNCIFNTIIKADFL